MGPLQLIALTCLLGLTKGQVKDSMLDPSSPETKDNSTWNVSEYPDPRIVIVGPTGAGKSSLSNALLGCDPILGSCVFPVCASLNSCTKETTIGTGQWLGDGQHFTVVDTPGFGDSDGQDNKLIEEMINVLNDDLGYTNIILLLLDGTMPRFTSGLHNMLRQMSSMFGDAWWDNMIIGVSKWEYSQAAIDKRKKLCDYFGHSSEHCKNEKWLMREISSQLQDKFHLDRNFTFAFIHSHSQTGPELSDSVQQEYYKAQAAILWEAATTGDSKFDFKTIDDVLEENELLKKKYRKLNFIFETNIATIYSLIHENGDRINGYGEKIVSNEQIITNNEEQMKSSNEKMKEDLKNAVDRIVGTEGRILTNEQDITINKKVIKSSIEKMKGDLKNAVDKTVEYERRINSNVEKINSMNENIMGAVNRIHGNEKGIQGNVFHIESNMEKINGIKGQIKEAVNRISGNEKAINSYTYVINTMKGNLKNAVDRIDGNEARILSNEKGINSNTVNTNRMKGELKNAVDRIHGNGAKILSNEKAITTNGQGVKDNLEKANTMKGDLEKAVGRIVVNERNIHSNEQTIKTNEKGIQSNMEKMKGELSSVVDKIDGNEARILGNEKGINSNSVNANRMKGELKNAFDRIDGNEAKIHSNEKAITANGQGIKGNLEKANTMERDLEKAVGSIVMNERKIHSNEQTIKTNERGIESNMMKMKGELSSAVDNLKLAPIGTIIAWINRPQKGKGDVITIPKGWQRCDGTTIQSPSKWAGLLTPNLNGEKRFLRGGKDKDMLNLEEDQAELRDHNHGYEDVQVVFEDGCKGSKEAYDDIGDCWRKTIEKTTKSNKEDIETRPKNMNVIYIMRVW